MNLQTIIFIGRSGCGKGTQVEKIAEYIKLKDPRKSLHLEAGNKFRDFIKGEGYSTLLAKDISEEGGLQPQFLSVWAWGSELVEKLEFDNHLFIDGTPRRKEEASMIESVFEFYNRPSVDIVYVNVSRNWAVNRLEDRGRADDVEMSDILNRMNWFESDVADVIDYYRSHSSHRFHDIDGEQSIEKVHEDIVKSLEI